MAPVREALEHFLRAHEPYPAVVVDGRWNLVTANDALAVLTEGVSSALLEPPANGLRITLHPDGMAPRIVNFARGVTDEERQRYYTRVAEAIDRCSPMPFTESMGGAVAGRTFRINFLDRRNSRKAEGSWPTEKS